MTFLLQIVLGQSSDVTSVNSAVEMSVHFPFRRVMTWAATGR
jgi:hypothetical protein